MSYPKKMKNPNPSPIGNRFGFLLFGGRGWIRTTEAEKQQIYSLSPLATREHAQIHFYAAIADRLYILPSNLKFVNHFLQKNLDIFCQPVYTTTNDCGSDAQIKTERRLFFMTTDREAFLASFKELLPSGFFLLSFLLFFSFPFQTLFFLPFCIRLTSLYTVAGSRGYDN